MSFPSASTATINQEQDSISAEGPPADAEVSPAPRRCFSDDQIHEKVMDMMRAAAPAKNVPVENDTSLDLLKMDSLEKLSLAMDLEEFFDLYIPDEDIEQFNKVDDFSIYIQQALRQEGASSGPTAAE